MNRDEAVFRELNLYPLWVRRDVPPAAATESVAVSIDPIQEAPAPAITPQPIPEMIPPMNAAPLSISHADLGWDELKSKVSSCSACKLRATCTQTVFGVGDKRAEWLFIGEGPGADEDIKGEPFVGQAGRLLDNMLAAIKLRRGDNVYIANIVKCRPPGNRVPEPDEIATCLPYLRQQVSLIQPKIIVALGKTAATSLLGRDASLASLRGQLHEFDGIPLVIAYHPAYLLRSPGEKAKTWQDLCLAVETFQRAKNRE